MDNLARKNIKDLVTYNAGKPIKELKREFGLRKVIKLASNENPLGPSPKAVEAIKKTLADINRYPDSGGFYLKAKLARVLNIKPANLVLGNGSDELIEVIIKTFVEEDENIVTAETTFLEYKIIARSLNRKVTTVPLCYFKYDLKAIEKKIDKKTKVVFIANPNNPTGTYLMKCELEDFISGLPNNVLVVLDEAYDAFVDVNDFPESLKLARDYNVIVLKTFSKAYGLAGLRAGYAVSKSELIASMEKVRQPFNVNTLAQEAALAALDDRQFLAKTRKVVLEGKSYLYNCLTGMGLSYVPSTANFILIEIDKDGQEVFQAMLRYGVIVRDMKQYGLKNFIRVTIGTKKENGEFIKVLKKVLR